MFRILFFILMSIGLSAYELSVLAMFRDESRYLKEWIDYHKLVGVEHFWLYNDHSADNWLEVLQPYIDEGTVDVINWGGGDTYGYTRQPAIYRDGIVRAKGVTKWLAIIDLDEFLLPMREQTITECLNKHYSDADAIYINWRNFGTSKVTVPEGGSILYHLTACSFTGHSNNSVGKCIVKPEVVVLESLWTPHHYEIQAGAKYYNGNGVLISYINGEAEFGGKHADKFLRVNHYVLRDEYFYWNFRYPRTGDKVLLQEHYESFCLVRDTAILKFVKKLYPAYFQSDKTQSQ